MAYEGMTYEVILARMIQRVSAQYPNLDIREGSIVSNALNAAALEMAVMYTELENSRNESFVNTATREYILLGCQQMGMDISTFEASAGVHKGVFNVEVPIGSRWNCEIFNYYVSEYIEQNEEGYTYQLICESTGTSPNNQTGDLTPISDIPEGLTSAKLVECLIEGENETSDADIITAYYEYINNSVSDGNVAQYLRWCSEYKGVGNAKVFPLWNGDNTVKVSILSASNGAASNELVAEFQEYLDPNSEGMGNGVAPIGAFVTVTTATEVPINIQATVTMKTGYTGTEDIGKAISNYFSSIAYKKTQVSYMNVGAAILQADGVESVTNLTINDKTSDIMLGDEEIPVLGTANWTVES